MISEGMKQKVGWGFSFDNPFNHHPVSNEEWMINKEESTDDFLLIQGYDANLYPTPNLGDGIRSKFWYDYTIHCCLAYLDRTGFKGTVQLDDVTVMQDGKVCVEDHWAKLSTMIEPLYQENSIEYIKQLINQASVMNPTLPSEDELYLNVNVISWDHKLPRKMRRSKDEDYHAVYELLSDIEASKGYLKRPVIVTREHKITKNLPSFFAALLCGHKRIWVKYQDKQDGREVNWSKHKRFNNWDKEDRQYDLR